MNNNVYEVKYEVLTQCEHKGNHRKTDKPTWSLNNTAIHILANGTAKAAIDKAEKFLLSRVEPFKSEYGEPMVERTLKVRVISCERVLTLDA